ncbi:MAG TPA: NADH-quinone oxidoreductase subunit NuoK [Oligoflexia bacterium]|nr:NADH-quinone oxidoreductase subunit NuoK [Oligoflexia bacterium]HMP47893.1 NADH-quinone oxidoreductase subunit NuoK [Oligoflexia bacterium]
MENLNFYLTVSSILFTLGVVGVMTRRNAIVMFMCIELMLNAVNLSLIAFATAFGDMHAQVFVFFVIAVAAAEAAVGLAIIMALFRNYYSIEVDAAVDLAG